MRIALVHSVYSSAVPSGENRVVEDQADLLAERGHDVMRFTVSTDDEQRRPLYGPRTAARVLLRTGVNPVDALRSFAPDVVHVQNTFPNIGSRWLRRWNGPIVMSVHNYRAACSNGLLMRDGRICHDCLEPRLHWAPAVQHACYRDSRVATAPVAWSRAGFRADLVAAGVTAVTTSTASDRLFRRMTQGRVPSVVIPNFVEDHADQEPAPLVERHGWIVVSRLSPEKGVVELVRDWPAGRPLTVVGDGPQAQSVADAAQARPEIRLVPAVPRDELRAMLHTQAGLVLPSRWHEVAPQVVVEAMCASLPVVAFADNDVAGLVVETGSGQLYRTAPELAEALDHVEGRWSEASRRARATYEAEWTPQAWLDRMTGLYAQVTA